VFICWWPAQRHAFVGDENFLHAGQAIGLESAGRYRRLDEGGARLLRGKSAGPCLCTQSRNTSVAQSVSAVTQMQPA
jgi:hypothetical protein